MQLRASPSPSCAGLPSVPPYRTCCQRPDFGPVEIMCPTEGFPVPPDLQEWFEAVIATLPAQMGETLMPLWEATRIAFAELADARAALADEAKELRALLELKGETIAGMQADRFDASSEKANRKRPKPIGEIAADPPPRPPKQSGRVGRQILHIPPHLPSETLDIALRSQFCSCGGTLYPFGQPEVRERICSRTAKTYIRRERYQKHKCSCCSAFSEPRAPKRIIEGSRLDRTFVGEVILDRFCRFLPYARQAKGLFWENLPIPRSTLARNVISYGRILKPLLLELEKSVAEGPSLTLDETRIPLLFPGLGRTHRGWAHAVCRHEARWNGAPRNAVVFKFHMARHGYFADQFIGPTTKVALSDGFAEYERLETLDRFGGKAPIQLANCNAHSRRGFVDANKIAESEIAQAMIDLYKEAYALESHLIGLPPQARASERARVALPVFEKMKKICLDAARNTLKGSKLGRAVNYFLKRFDRLTKYLRNGTIEIDNNIVENLNRSIALLRKNGLFAGSIEGAETWMLFSSLFATCHLNSVNPSAYLHWLLEKVEAGHPLSRYDELLPWHCPVGLHRPYIR